MTSLFRSNLKRATTVTTGHGLWARALALVFAVVWTLTLTHSPAASALEPRDEDTDANTAPVILPLERASWSGPQADLQGVPSDSQDFVTRLASELHENRFQNSEKLTDTEIEKLMETKFGELKTNQPPIPLEPRAELYRLAAYFLERAGVEYDVSYDRTPLLLIRPVKKKGLNAIAFAIQKEDGTRLAYSPEEVMGDLLGYFRARNPSRPTSFAMVALDTRTVMKAGLESTGLHELVHWKFEARLNEGNPSSFSAEILDSAPPTTFAKRLNSYAEFMSVEELVTHLRDITWMRIAAEKHPEWSRDPSLHPRLFKKIDRAQAIARFVEWAMEKNIETVESAMKVPAAKLSRAERRATLANGTQVPTWLFYTSDAATMIRIKHVVGDVHSVQLKGEATVRFPVLLKAASAGPLEIGQVDIHEVLRKNLELSQINLSFARSVSPSLTELRLKVLDRTLTLSELEAKMDQVNSVLADHLARSWQGVDRP